jgi:ribonuclease HI
MDSQTQKPKVVIYSDGGAKPNPNGPGGWAVLLISGENRRELSGGERSTTNNRMELTAACEALEALKTACEVEFHTDSQYVKNGITTWMKNWIKNGWKTASKQPVANQDLWERLDAATTRHSIQWKWVRGHAGHEHNERVDHLATAARERIQRGG